MKLIKDENNVIHIDVDVSEIPSKEFILKNLTTPKNMLKEPKDWDVRTSSEVCRELIDFLTFNDDDFIYSELPMDKIVQVNVV